MAMRWAFESSKSSKRVKRYAISCVCHMCLGGAYTLCSLGIPIGTCDIRMIWHIKGPKQDRSLEAPWHLRYKTFGPPELMKILLPQKSGQKESCSARRDESGGWHPFFSQTNIFHPNFASKLKTYHCSSPTLMQN